MKSLIILKGLVKSEKKKWVEEEGLSTFFLDYEIHTVLYSTPELIKKKNSDMRSYLGRIKTKQAYTSFISAVNSRMESGCLVVVDPGLDKTGVYETMANVYGYEVFYKVFPVPQDYIGNPKKYSNPMYRIKTSDELKDDVLRFMSSQYDNKNRIETYDDLLKYWGDDRKYKTIEIPSNEDVYVFSDIHGNYNLLKPVLDNIPVTSYKFFLGDYIDGEKIPGGSRNMIEYILRYCGGYNTWIEGNHEKRIRKYLFYLSTRGSTKSERNNTIREILYSSLPEDWVGTVGKEFDSLTDKEAKMWLARLNSIFVLYSRIKYRGVSYILSHGGLRCLEQISPKFIGNLLYGNRDMDEYDRSFSRNVWKKEDIWSIHGHCKYPDKNPEILKYDGVINLDPRIDREKDTPEIIYINLKDNKPCIVR